MWTDGRLIKPSSTEERVCKFKFELCAIDCIFVCALCHFYGIEYIKKIQKKCLEIGRPLRTSSTAAAVETKEEHNGGWKSSDLEKIS
jgi:hypothetical protein